MESLKIYSIGHGNKTLDEFLSILHANKIASVADIRSYPYSKRNPQFNQQALEKEGGERLLCVGRKGKTAVMCAETLPFRCHRWLLSDHLVSNNIQVLHIIDERKTMIHKLSRHATIRNGNVVYDH